MLEFQNIQDNMLKNIFNNISQEQNFFYKNYKIIGNFKIIIVSYVATLKYIYIFATPKICQISYVDVCMFH
jgi:hypothetical protein